MDILKDKQKRKGLIVTVLWHLALLILFAFYGLTFYDPPLEPREGFTVNFGTSDQGMFNEQNNTPSEQTETAPTESSQAEPEPVETVQEEVITQNSTETVAINKEKEKTVEEVIPDEKKEEPIPDENLTNALEKWKNKKSEPSGGDGVTGQKGDQGNIDGDPNSKNYNGGGIGNDPRYTLSGRSMLSTPTIKDDSPYDGKVVVDIIVDKYGKVLRASPGGRGSTTSNATLYKKAKEAALKTKFNANPNAAEEQKGQMTFIFILN